MVSVAILTESWPTQQQKWWLGWSITAATVTRFTHGDQWIYYFFKFELNVTHTSADEKQDYEQKTCQIGGNTSRDELQRRGSASWICNSGDDCSQAFPPVPRSVSSSRSTRHLRMRQHVALKRHFRALQNALRVFCTGVVKHKGHVKRQRCILIMGSSI